MDFDVKRFKLNLEKHRSLPIKERKDTQGKTKVIEHVWLHSPTDSINFDSFTLQDIEDAMVEMARMPLVYDEGGEMFTCDPSNLFLVFDRLFSVCFDLTNTKNKKFVLEEDAIFL
ncbi:hypothetical protein CJ195_15610 [Bacillus sp. UMB0899]|nr:hypothetical protein CJ195_15610 [Bacillus sp. UMB0899]